MAGLIRSGGAIRWRRLLPLSLISLAVCLLLAPQRGRSQEDPPPRKYTRPVLIHFEGPITPLLEAYFERKLDTARDRNADLVIVKINSPGGFLDASLNIAERLRHLDWARTVAFVARGDEAISGAAIAALGCDDIVMAPEARLGDAGAIFQDEDAYFRYVPEKIRSVLARQVRDLAEAKGRPPALAEAMVDKDMVVFEVRDKASGEITFMAEHEIEGSDDPDNWEKIKPVKEARKDYFLTVNGTRAVELKLARATANDEAELRELYQWEGQVLELRSTAVDTTVTILNAPIVTGLILVIGLIALYVEFSAPGIGVGGLIAGLCFALFFWSRFLGGTAGMLELILFAAGIVFLAVELFVLPGFGVAGISGLLLILVSVVMAGQHFIVPSTGRELSVTVTSLKVIAASAVVFFVAAIAISHYFGSIPIIGWLALEPPAVQQEDAEAADGKGSPRPGGAARFPVQTGDWGVAESPLRPAGRVRFGDEFVDVVTDGPFVDRGRQVRVIEISGNRVVVREIEETG